MYTYNYTPYSKYKQVQLARRIQLGTLELLKFVPWNKEQGLNQSPKNSWKSFPEARSLNDRNWIGEKNRLLQLGTIWRYTRKMFVSAWFPFKIRLWTRQC